ncbi:hypothetical protein BS50DRAFT_152970 [Corynespora cassiicola Philippines]|uniref:Zn(2)-C6 fungal-type domain-containing protein n=1 Tax=Corynespora cassiicola Philippines TaxID=1448308 RepID=A0A2T2N7S2_CORCC|nr:hypothetical protein BS50DRAFT_152970 [Corynespora cassiicola Philippines]
MRVTSRCGTCRARKIKCDRGRPACKRCVSTGRVCEGYGVWGGGNNPSNQKWPMARAPLLVAQAISPMASGRLSPDERVYTEWFVQNTAARMSGVFISTFWHTLILQANFHETAILHATVALAAAHKRHMLSLDAPNDDESLDEEERYTLCQYNKAITHIRPFFANKDRASVRVVLITCMIFTCLEFLRGRYQTGHQHLRNGLRLLEETHPHDNSSEDAWLFEVFFTLNVQTALFQYSLTPKQMQRPPPLPSIPSSTQFDNILQARQSLDRFSNMTYRLYAEQRLPEDPRPYTEMLLCQRFVSESLSNWKSAFDGLQTNLLTGSAQALSRFDTYALYILHINYTLTTILAATCLRREDEMVFDHHTPSFNSILEQLVNLMKLVSPQKLTTDPTASGCERWAFCADMGVIPPLYYTAIKCRVLHLRRRAIELLRLANNQEGIWDATLCAAIAEVAIRDEELRSGFHINANGSPLGEHESEAMIPEQARIQDIEIILPDEPRGRVGVVYKRRQEDGSWGSFERDFVYVRQSGYAMV